MCTGFKGGHVIGVIALATAPTTAQVHTGCAKLTAVAEFFHFISSLYSILDCNNKIAEKVKCVN